MPKPWFPFARPLPDAEHVLLTLPFAGGSAQVFRSWGGILGPRVQVLAAELPGHGTRVRESAVDDLDALVEALLPEVARVADGRPVAVFGHSLGAFAAVEFARRYEPAPVRCFVSGARPPDVPARRPLLHDLDDEAFVAALAGLGGTPAAVLADRELLELFLPALRADFRMAERHQREPGSGLAVPLEVFCGERDTYVDPATMAGWQRFAAAGCGLHRFPGGHFFLLELGRAVPDRIAELLGAG